mmetsp:Transcript_11016/g.25182  ORF Transcript_11016/g.25182 Transcript_11016/m.25182 type:complete len:222 (+) Transcript_11016:74-739(+)
MTNTDAVLSKEGAAQRFSTGKSEVPLCITLHSLVHQTIGVSPRIHLCQALRSAGLGALVEVSGRLWYTQSLKQHSCATIAEVVHTQPEQCLTERGATTPFVQAAWHACNEFIECRGKPCLQFLTKSWNAISQVCKRLRIEKINALPHLLHQGSHQRFICTVQLCKRPCGVRNLLPEELTQLCTSSLGNCKKEGSVHIEQGRTCPRSVGQILSDELVHDMQR